MLTRYLHEQHNVIEKVNVVSGTVKSKEDQKFSGKEDQAVKILDREMEAMTDKNILREARKT